MLARQETSCMLSHSRTLLEILESPRIDLGFLVHFPKSKGFTFRFRKKYLLTYSSPSPVGHKGTFENIADFCYGSHAKRQVRIKFHIARKFEEEIEEDSANMYTFRIDYLSKTIWVRLV